MADVFDIDSGSYRAQSKNSQVYNNRSGGWIPIEKNSISRKDPRLASRRDDGRRMFSRSPSPHRSNRAYQRHSSENSSSPPKSLDRDGWRSPQRMYTQPPPAQSYQHTQHQTMYPDYNTGYNQTASYQHGYSQAYGHVQNTSTFGQYNQQTNYPQQTQGYSGGHHQLLPPGEEYPGAWAPVTNTYPNVSQPPPPPVPRPSSVASSAQAVDKTDDLKKEAAIAQEMKTQRATLLKQREEYLRKASVLRRELDKLRAQKHELLTDKSPPRDSQRVLRENGNLQVEIQNKLKSINNVVDMLSGIIGDGLRMDDENKSNSRDSTPNRVYKDMGGGGRRGTDSSADDDAVEGRSEGWDPDLARYNYVHYDPELHWCRVCDVFPRSAKDLLDHLQSAEHRQVTQEHQLVDTPWHKLPPELQLPSNKSAPIKRVPIKGLQFFISTTAWYCKLCDTWIGDLHCASFHLKSRAHITNYSNFVEQNPHWETNWLKDREKAYARCAKAKGDTSDSIRPPAPELPSINEMVKHKKRKDKHDSPFLESFKEKKRKKKAKKRKKMESSGSSTSSSSSDSSSQEESDKAKSIRVAMRNKMRMQAQLILNEELGGKLEALGRLVEEERSRKEDAPNEIPQPPTPPPPPVPTQPDSVVEDNIINQWMTVTTNNDKHILDNLKGRLKQRQEADKEKAIEAAAEQRRREREREERELKEMREREQREMEERMREEREREEHDQEERERIKERERNRRRQSRSPEHFRGRSRGRSHSRGRSRSRSIGHRRHLRRSPGRFDGRNEPRHSPDDKYKPRRGDYDDDDSRNSSEPPFKSRNRKHSSSSTRKLPFIGRMPVYKKKPDGEEKEIKKEDYEVRLSKFEPGYTARAFIPEPGVVHITKLATPQDPMQGTVKINAENPPPPPQIIPEPPKISNNVAPPSPPIIHDMDSNDMLEMTAATDIQDMELDDATAPPLPPGVPVAEAKPLAKPAGNHLPRDFQEALNIIFPGDQMPEHLAAVQNDPNLMMQYQYNMGYGMMYPGMQMYDYSAGQEAGDDETGETEPARNKTEPPVTDDKEDLAMLGIDAEDMAAQTI